MVRFAIGPDGLVPTVEVALPPVVHKEIAKRAGEQQFRRDDLARDRPYVGIDGERIARPPQQQRAVDRIAVGRSS